MPFFRLTDSNQRASEALSPLVRFVFFCVLLGISLPSERASAHQIGLSKGSYTLQGRTLLVTWDLARGEFINLVPSVDQNKDRRLDEAEIRVAHKDTHARVLSRIRVFADKKPCIGALIELRLLELDGVAVHARYTCPTPFQAITWTIELFADLSYGHRHLASIVHQDRRQDAILFRHHPTYTLRFDRLQGSPQATLWGIFLMGIEHILIGFDHLLFLFALVLLGGSARVLIGIITAFTLAHSITLSIATLGIWIPSSKIIEPAIALSIAYVGIENFFVKKIDHRWLLTFLFGLIHGFGFASALREVGISGQHVAATLVLFNLGVEVGQILVLAGLLPLILAAHRTRWFAPRGIQILSAFVVIAGCAWFIERIL